MHHIVRIDRTRPEKAPLARAIAVLKRGGLVVFPTETAYGLGCDATRSEAVRRVFAVKGRDPSKPLPLILPSRSSASFHASMDRESRALAAAFWPGPLTLVLQCQAPKRRTGARHQNGEQVPGTVFPAGVASREGEVAVRVSPHPVASALARGLGRPLVATSANLSGGETPYDVLAVLRQLGTMPDLVLDAGRLPKRKTSTIVRCRGGKCEILRPGAAPLRDVMKALRACR